MTTEHIVVETRGRVGLIRLNRPQALNALNAALMRELSAAVDGFEADGAIGCMVITGSEKAFAAGADIKEMADKDFTDVFLGDFAAAWDRVAQARKPVVAAVAGFALGGGCELALQCDLIIAADTPSSVSRKSSSGSFRASAARSASRARSARPRRWTSSSPAA